MTLNIECCYAQCSDLLLIMLNDVMLGVIMLNVVVLSVIMLSVVILNVVAPEKAAAKNIKKLYKLFVKSTFH
jgi:hypothetical protein